MRLGKFESLLFSLFILLKNSEIAESVKSGFIEFILILVHRVAHKPQFIHLSWAIMILPFL